MGLFEARTFIDRQGAEAIFTPLIKAHREHATVQRREGQFTMRSAYGEVFGAADGEGCRIELRAANETHLAYLKMAVAWPLVAAYGADFPLAWSGEDTVPSTPGFFREARVVHSRRIGPHMQRVRLALRIDDQLADGGLHVRLLLPPKGRDPVWPTVAGNGLMAWPGGEDALTVRVYTLRAVNAREDTVDIDFVLHAGASTPGADFAVSAQPGDQIGLLGPGGDGVPQARDLLLFGDDTALPAIARIIETAPAETRIRAFVEVDGPADRQAIAHPRAAGITWLYRQGRARGTAGLLHEALETIDPATLSGDAFVWAGCEFSDFKALRSTLRKSWRLPKARHMVAAYWRRGTCGEMG